LGLLAGPAWGQNVTIRGLLDATGQVVQVGDTANTAIRVNCVVGCGAGSGATGLQVRNAGDTAWVNLGVSAEGATILHLPIRLQGTGANVVEPLNANPAGAEYALPVRNIPSGTQPVSGTFWQATQPVSGTFWQATQPVSGTVTSNQGGAPWTIRVQDGAAATLATVTAGNALKVDGSAVTQPVSGTFWQATQPVSGTFWQATQPVSGTVTTTPPANASTNVAQFGGNAVVTGTGIGGVGVPRVTISNDSSLAANQSVNVAQFGASAVVTGTGIGGVGVPRVTVSNDTQLRVWDGTTQAGVIAATTALKTDLSSVAGTATVTGAVGVQAVSIRGVANAAFDAANNAAAPANVLVTGRETITATGSNPTSATSGNVRRGVSDLQGNAFVRIGGPNGFSCFVQAVTVTTQCVAAPAAGLRAYVMSASMSNQVATVQTLDLIYGTGANCVTGPVALTHKIQMGTNATTTSPQDIELTFLSPLVPVAANAICVRPSAATAFGVTLTGFIAP
jgi:hypothetical protein